VDPRDHLRTNLVAGALTSTHLTIRTLMPLLLAALGADFGFADGRLGELGAAYGAGATLAAMTSPVWMSGLRMRGPALALLALGLGAMGGVLVVHDFASLMLLFAVAGLGHGGVFALMIAMLGRTADPSRSYGWQWSLGSVPGIVLLYAAPALSSPRYALPVTFGLVLAVNVLMSLPALRLPVRLAAPSPAAPGTQARSAPAPAARGPAAVGLFAVFAMYAGITGAWAFFGRIAVTGHLGVEFSGIVLAVATAASSAVSLLAGEAGNRGARPAPMAAAALGIIATLLMIALVPGRVGYAIGVVVSIALAGYVVPFSIGIVSRLDATGRATGLSAAALGIGAIAGPAVAGHVYQSAGAPTMIGVASAMVLAGLVAYLAVFRRAFPPRPRG
jgi:predicted MFS family arabinose efflux permease